MVISPLELCSIWHEAVRIAAIQPYPRNGPLIRNVNASMLHYPNQDVAFHNFGSAVPVLY
jgi:hypothetical protein